MIEFLIDCLITGFKAWIGMSIVQFAIGGLALIFGGTVLSGQRLMRRLKGDWRA